MTKELLILETPEAIRLYRLRTLQQALRLECLGMKRSRPPSAYSIIKKEFGLRGSREAVYTRFCELIQREAPHAS